MSFVVSCIPSSVLAWGIPKDEKASCVAVFRVAQSPTRLKRLSSSSVSSNGVCKVWGVLYFFFPFLRVFGLGVCVVYGFSGVLFPTRGTLNHDSFLCMNPNLLVDFFFFFINFMKFIWGHVLCTSDIPKSGSFNVCQIWGVVNEWLSKLLSRHARKGHVLKGRLPWCLGRPTQKPGKGYLCTQ